MNFREEELKQIFNKEDDPELMARVPADDVWIRAYYPDPRLTFIDAVNRLRQFAAPEMADNMEGTVKLHLTLNMSTKKKVSFSSRFMGYFSSGLCIPISHQI
jgi:hypothetical protein